MKNDKKSRVGWLEFEKRNIHIIVRYSKLRYLFGGKL